jgi:hypothetical protein
MMGKSNIILDYFKRKNTQSSLEFDHRLRVTYRNIILINEVQNNLMHVVLFEVCTLSSITNLSGLVIWIL